MHSLTFTLPLILSSSFRHPPTVTHLDHVRLAVSPRREGPHHPAHESQQWVEAGPRGAAGGGEGGAAAGELFDVEAPHPHQPWKPK